MAKWPRPRRDSGALAERHRIHPGEPADFRVQNTTEIANTLGIVTGTLTLMLVGDRRHLAARRRRRHHEHHARLRDRADPRDRHPHGRRRPPATSCASSWSRRSCSRASAASSASRWDRRRSGIDRLINSCTSGPSGRSSSRSPAAGIALRSPPARRHVLRLLPRPAGEQARPDRGAAVRVARSGECRKARTCGLRHWRICAPCDFIETPLREIVELMDDETYQSLQLGLLLRRNLVS